jgi:predicted RNase H-like HicB family nuclease
MNVQFAALIERGKKAGASLRPAWDIASQGDAAESARGNLREATKLFFGFALAQEIRQWS